ncbi:ribosome-releasing factor 2, mitochondrial [Diabrotica virgifera virgifera]|uniref:Ribosome-releasing factor 2, mitochondrial n=1 Tax=Diabrotica virgifera virgifera TaxID=50390 RepID=A0A6P7FLV5_DIAVI|nr:ribosome-releasing factor 2, mitochondrial [Diabrotica virgifera virgifera]
MNSNLRNFGLNFKRTLRKFNKLYTKINQYNTGKEIQNVPIEKIRNIGILAHIDAGKTTTTERMLFISGLIQNMGEVHRGNTVTDYMEQERERGITITSAAVTFYWKKNQFNLIDTPGHIDFTMEVEQTLNVLDGAIVVLDGTAGVEAQTLTVWRQAEKNKIPRIIYVNKMDRSNASISLSCETIEKKLQSPYLLLQLPVVENNKLTGIIDILTMELITYGTEDIKLLEKVQLTEKNFPKHFEEAKLARSKLVDKLCNYDDNLADQVLVSESLDNIPTTDIVKSLRTVTKSQTAVPVLLGSSYKNVGVQNLMDAVILYLPAPNEKNMLFLSFEDNLCARAFKVIHNKQKGPLVFLRIYNGQIKRGQKIYNIKQDCSEQIGRLYVAYADDFKEIDSIANGNIAVATGVKKVMSGDLITTSNNASQKAKNSILKKTKDRTMEEKDINKIFGIGVAVPEPVFFRSIEPPSASSQTHLDLALSELQREDPSLRVTYNSETGQTILAGMGELHLDIIKDRIMKEYKLEVELGPLQIAYKETPIEKLTDTLTVETKIGSSKQFITVKLTLQPVVDLTHSNEVLKLDKSPEYASNIASIFPKHLVAVRQGVEVGLSHGPKISCPVINVQVILHYLEVGRGTSDTMITATVTQLIQKILKQVNTYILEPVMSLEVVTPEEHLSVIVADLSRRRTNINNIGMRGNSKVVLANTPLSELLGYSTILRTISSGTATFTMQFLDCSKMSPELEMLAIQSVRGF